jgi:transcription termination factor Rho
MKNTTRISYTFLLLAIGIVSTILSNPILAQTAGTAGGQQQQGNQTGGQQQGTQEQEGIGSIEELEKLTAPPNVTQDTTSLAEGLEKSQTGEAVPGEQDVKFEGQDNQTAGQQQQQQGGNQTAGQQQQGGNQTAGQQQQQGGNQTAGQQQQQGGNQTGGPLEEVGKAIGKLFQ